MAGTLGGGLLGYLFHFFVSRQLSVAQYGELQTLISLFAIFGVFSSSLGYFVVKHVSVFASRNDREATEKFSRFLSEKIFRFSVIFLIFFVILSPFFKQLLHLGNILGLLLVGAGVVFNFGLVLYQEALRAWEKFLLITYIGIAAAFLKLISGVILGKYTGTASLVILSFSISVLTGWFIAKRLASKVIFKTGAGTAWSEGYFPELEITKIMKSIFIFSLLIALLQSLDVVLVKSLAGAELTGYYGALGLLGKVVFWINLSIVGVVLPKAFVDGYEGKKLRFKYHAAAYGLIILVSLGSLASYYLFPNLVVKAFFGNKYLVVAGNLWFFALIAFFLSILNLEANLAFANHKFKLLWWLAISILIMTLGIRYYHGSILQIASAVGISYLVGYFGIVFSHYFPKILAFEKSEG